MAERSVDGERFVQIGMSALRDPTGAFLPAVPLYIKIPASKVNEQSDMSTGEQELCADISGIFAEKFAAYIKGCREEEIKI